MEPRVLAPEGGEEYIPYAKAHWRRLVASGGWKKTLHTGDCLIIISRDEILILKQSNGNFVCHPRTEGDPSMDDGTTVEVGTPEWEADAAGDQYGNLDWKGDEQVLTWRGPTDRYGLNQPLFTERPGFTRPEEYSAGVMAAYQSFYWPFVFQDGDIVAMAPPIPEGSNAAETLYPVGGEDIDVTARYHVLGAGVFDGAIVAVVAEYRLFRAYLLQQTGFSEWKTLYTFAPGELMRPWKPWFFSKDGSKAVMVQGDQYRVLTITGTGEEVSAVKEVFSAVVTPFEAGDDGSSYTMKDINEFPTGTGTTPPLAVNCRKSEPCWGTDIEPYNNKEVGQHYEYLTKFRLKGKRITAADWKENELVFAYAEQSGTSESSVDRKSTTVWGATAQNDGITDHAAAASLSLTKTPSANDPLSAGTTFTLQSVSICIESVVWSITGTNGCAIPYTTSAQGAVANAVATITSIPGNCCIGSSGSPALVTVTATVTARGTGVTYTASKLVRLPGGILALSRSIGSPSTGVAGRGAGGACQTAHPEWFTAVYFEPAANGEAYQSPRTQTCTVSAATVPSCISTVATFCDGTGQAGGTSGIGPWMEVCRERSCNVDNIGSGSALSVYLSGYYIYKWVCP